MKAFAAFFGKEIMELKRSGKLMFLTILFTLFGIMNPAVAKLTPWLFEILSDSMEASGITVNQITVTAAQSWEQFFKNIPIALIVVIVMFAGIFSREYAQNTLVPLLTKGLSKSSVTLAKTLIAQLVWAGGFWLCFGITYVYSAYYWDNSIMEYLGTAAAFWYLNGVWLIAVMMLFAVLSDTNLPALLGTGAMYLLSVLLGFLPRCKEYVPTYLTSGASICTSAAEVRDYIPSLVIALCITTVCTILSVFLGRKKA